MIKDDSGKDLYKGKGKFLSLLRKKKLKTLEGETLYVIRNKFFHSPIHKTAIIKDDDGVVAKLSFSPSFRYIVKNCAYNIVIEGGLFNTNLTIYKDGIVACKARTEISLNGKFVIDVIKDSDAPFMIALLIAMSNIQKKK